MPVFRDCAGHAGCESRSLVALPGLFSVGRVGEELAVDRVADPSFQRAEGFFATFAFGLFAEVVGTSWCVVADLGDGGDVQRVVELPVPAAG